MFSQKSSNHVFRRSIISELMPSELNYDESFEIKGIVYQITQNLTAEDELANSEFHEGVLTERSSNYGLGSRIEASHSNPGFIKPTSRLQKRKQGPALGEILPPSSLRGPSLEKERLVKSNLPKADESQQNSLQSAGGYIRQCNGPREEVSQPHSCEEIPQDLRQGRTAYNIVDASEDIGPVAQSPEISIDPPLSRSSKVPLNTPKKRKSSEIDSVEKAERPKRNRRRNTKYQEDITIAKGNVYQWGCGDQTETRSPRKLGMDPLNAFRPRKTSTTNFAVGDVSNEVSEFIKPSRTRKSPKSCRVSTRDDERIVQGSNLSGKESFKGKQIKVYFSSSSKFASERNRPQWLQMPEAVKVGLKVEKEFKDSTEVLCIGTTKGIRKTSTLVRGALMGLEIVTDEWLEASSEESHPP
ncbi:MAG: hypothetical protein M1814_003833 [Vezdaea aestivalis]|nr:MAG: hypothetical protein M1814_003833 [Vezdaea aestivalis]